MTASNFIQALLLVFAFWIVFLLTAKVTPARAAKLTAVALILSAVSLFVGFTEVAYRSLEEINSNYLGLVVIVYFIASVITFLMYGYDNRSAKEKGQRISERTLHLLDLMGGWPGAMVGQRHFGYKPNSKTDFRFKITTLGIALVHVAILTLWTTGVLHF